MNLSGILWAWFIYVCDCMLFMYTYIYINIVIHINICTYSIRGFVDRYISIYIYISINNWIRIEKLLAFEVLYENFT